ncbi:uncharacterized protein LOC115159899 isoform X4 [Salmo trutta]|uniref:uncharacterized protein LOC115159899 isoform X4 n=1 Tax=Salmo trutta TaxID=8032 RepID=UPI0011300A53|nr:uncharacterized protein LOC115159899 isoform X4 [Salmo trutta]
MGLTTAFTTPTYGPSTACRTGRRDCLRLAVEPLIKRLSGTDGIRLMSVWTGDSINIPCIYHQDYINHVKYWCKGHSWITCSYVVRTDHPNSSDSPIVDQEETGVEGGSVFTSIPTIQQIFAVQTTTQFTTTITMPIPTTQELSSSSSQASVNNTHHGAQRWERTLVYLPKTVNAVVFLLCTIMAVVKYRTNRLRGQTEDE